MMRYPLVLGRRLSPHDDDRGRGFEAPILLISRDTGEEVAVVDTGHQVIPAIGTPDELAAFIAELPRPPRWLVEEPAP